MKQAVCIENLRIGYRQNGRTTIVSSNLNAHLIEGSLTCLIGFNGVGKSTLLRTLAGFLPPLSGLVRIYGEDLRTLPLRFRSKTIGIVLTDRTDVKNFTARDVVSLGRSPYTGFFDKLTDEDQSFIQESIRMVGIEDIQNRLVETLSDGERQKVMIAKVLAQQTPIILLDEPTAFLDYPSKMEILDLLLTLAHKMKKTIIVSTHDLGTALEKTDNIWLMTKQQVLRTGSTVDFGLTSPITVQQIMRLF